MVGLGWMEILLLLVCAGLFFGSPILVLLIYFAAGRLRETSAMSRPASQPALRSSVQSANADARPTILARLPLFIAIWIFGLICLVVAIGATYFVGSGNESLWLMFAIGLLLFGLFTAVMIGSFVIAIIRQPAANVGSVAGPPMAMYDATSHIEVVARLTQRFCPQCRSPLDADAPEGLCPACLMAGGLASAAVQPIDGLAATTPPTGLQLDSSPHAPREESISRSEMPTIGEWADLAQHFPDLEVLELLGRGGMGAVYKARQKKLDRLVALKVIPPDAAQDPAFTERFAREARAMARMNHPNIVTVHDYGHEDGLYWLLMEYVDGVNLRHTLRAGHLAPREALAIVPQVCDALQYAHDQGVVHRDIKPENVLLDRSGRVKIADFGLAKLLGKGPDDFTLTRSQQVMGTPRYMAPEQIERPSAVDHRADIYSLGVVLYEMLTGELPLGRFEPPSHKVQVDVRIDQVVLRALEKSPERRYQRASEIKTELASAASWPALAVPVTTISHPAAGDANAVQAPRRNMPLEPVAALAAPSWHTPSPATKFEFWDPSQPGGVPLRYVLGVAVGMVLGVLMITAGVAAGIYGLINFPGLSGGWWGWMGAAFGCVVGGFGSTAGSYNSYRQMTGAEDLMRSPRVTWFDWVMRGYFLVGILLIGAALTAHDGSPAESFRALLILGGVATFQATLFLLWRMLIRPAAAAGEHLATSAERDLPAEPSYLRAVLWPTLAMAAVFGVLLADIHFALPIPSAQGGITQKMTTYRQWYETIVVTALITVPLCFFVLGVWRTWGPRHIVADGSWAVPFPFTHRAWLWAIAALATLSLFLPWFRLEVVPSAEVALSTKDIHPEATSYQSFVVKAEQLRNIAAISAGGRFSMRGMEEAITAAAATLLIFMALMSAFAVQRYVPARVTFLLLAGGIVLLLVTNLLHWAADQRAQVVVDDVTESGLQILAANMHGSQPPTVEPWKRAVRPAIVAQPTFGAFAILTACGLAIFFGVTELSWGAVLPTGDKSAAQPARAGPVPQLATIDPARAAVLAKVGGPGIGLMIVGILGFLPILIALLAVPAWTLTPMQGKPDPDRLEYPEPVPVPLPVPPAGPSAILPLSIAPVALARLPLAGPLITLPILVAQETDTVAIGLMFPIVALLWLLNLAFSMTLIIGGWRMRQARSYGLSLIAAIMALLPCTFGWILGLPIGIWALVVLMDPAVKAGFST